VDSSPPASPVATAIPTDSGAGTTVVAPYLTPKPAPAKVNLEQADQLYRDKRYHEAGKCYAALARESRLPAYRKEHWAYCRYVALAEWIKRGPRSAREWDQIEEEFASIKRLSTNGWLAEYMKSLIAERRSRSAAARPRSENLYIRGSAPDDEKPRRWPRLFGKGRSRPDAAPEAAPAAAAPARQQPLDPLPAGGEAPVSPTQKPDAAPGGATGTIEPGHPLEPLEPEVRRDSDRPSPVDSNRPSPVDSNRPSPVDSDRPSPANGSPWQTHETANFRIFHQNARLAESAGRTAEAVRAAQASRWGSQAAFRAWNPRCELYLYPDGKALAQATQQPESSPGFSTMTSNGSEVVARRVNLRADHPNLLAAILPHEVTHVVLADLFTAVQIPRWADEGIAVMAEPRSEQRLRWQELQQPLETGRIFALDKLVAMDYPNPKDWSLYYAQSVSLTRFLVESGPPERFISFVLDSLQRGTEPALKDAYQINGFAQLQERWIAYARQQVATPTVSAGGTSRETGTTTTR
jgi:hypothetical protein